MLFLISESITAYKFRDDAPDNVIRALQRVLHSYGDGNHVVVMPRDTCSRIESSDLFSPWEKATAAKIRIKYSEYGRLKSVVKEFAVIVEAGYYPYKAGNIWNVPTAWIAEKSLDKLSLICEDLHDAELLEGAAKDIIFRNHLHSLTVSVLKVNGGGANTNRTFFNLAVDEQKISLCVVDSDRLSPLSDIGQTAQKCVEVVGNGLYELKITKGRSLENALPWRLVDQHSLVNAPIPFLRQLRTVNPDAVRFLDFKFGLNGYDITNMQLPCAGFWLGVASAVSGPTGCCPSAQKCTKTDWKDCVYKIHQGFGRPLLGAVADWFSKTDTRARVQSYCPSENLDEWDDLGMLVASYGLGVHRTRS